MRCVHIFCVRWSLAFIACDTFPSYLALTHVFWSIQSLTFTIFGVLLILTYRDVVQFYRRVYSNTGKCHLFRCFWRKYFAYLIFIYITKQKGNTLIYESYYQEPVFNIKNRWAKYSNFFNPSKKYYFQGLQNRSLFRRWFRRLPMLGNKKKSQGPGLEIWLVEQQVVAQLGQLAAWTSEPVRFCWEDDFLLCQMGTSALQAL